MTSDSSVGMEALEGRLRDGDPHALAELFSRERERLWRVIQFRLAEPLRGRLEPDDVLQEAFLAASQRLKHYADSPATSPFIWFDGAIGVRPCNGPPQLQPSLAPIPDRAEFPHAATTARSRPSFRLPSLRAVAPGDASRTDQQNSHPPRSCTPRTH